jgi:Fis family transcriptional regulator
MKKTENELSLSVRRLTEAYFHSLDGEVAVGFYDLVLHSVEKPLLETVLNHTNGNQTQAAQVLGMTRNTLRKKMQLHGVK